MASEKYGYLTPPCVDGPYGEIDHPPICQINEEWRNKLTARGVKIGRIAEGVHAYGDVEMDTEVANQLRSEGWTLQPLPYYHQPQI